MRLRDLLLVLAAFIAVVPARASASDGVHRGGEVASSQHHPSDFVCSLRAAPDRALPVVLAAALAIVPAPLSFEAPVETALGFAIDRTRQQPPGEGEHAPRPARGPPV